MSKDAMTRAQELIKEKKYDEARVILRSTSHPNAPTWLAKLDEIDPPTTTKERLNTEPVPIRRPNPKKEEKKIPIPLVFGCLRLILLTGVCAFGAIYAATRFAEFFEAVTTLPARFSEPLPIQYDIPVSGTLGEGNDFEEFWVFQANEGDFLIITMRSNEIDSLLSLYTEEGTFLVDDDDSGGGEQGSDSQIYYTIPHDGSFVLAASQWYISDGGGTYTLALEKQ